MAVAPPCTTRTWWASCCCLARARGVSTSAALLPLAALLVLLCGLNVVSAADVPRCHVDYNRFSGKTTSKGVWAGLTYDLQFSMGLCESESTDGVMSVQLNSAHQNITGRSGTVTLADLGVVHFSLSSATTGAQYFTSELCYSEVNCTTLCAAALMGYVDSCKVERTVMPVFIVLFWVVPAIICIGFITALYVRKRMEEREQALQRLPEGYSRSPRVSAPRRPLRSAADGSRSPSAPSSETDEGAAVPPETTAPTSAKRPQASSIAAAATAPVVVNVPDAGSFSVTPSSADLAQRGLFKPHTSLLSIVKVPTGDLSHDATSEHLQGETRMFGTNGIATEEELGTADETSSSEMDDLHSLRMAHTRGPSNTGAEEDIHIDAEERKHAVARTQEDVLAQQTANIKEPARITIKQEAAEEAARIAAAEEAARVKAEQEAAEEAARIAAAEEAARVKACDSQRRAMLRERHPRRQIECLEVEERAALRHSLDECCAALVAGAERRRYSEAMERVEREMRHLTDVEEAAGRSLLQSAEHEARVSLEEAEVNDYRAAEAALEAAEKDLLDATVSYNAEYRARMMAKAQPDVNVPPPRPFIGFSLAEDVKRGVLVVDGLYKDGPAYQTGIRIGDILLRVCAVDVNTIAEARRVVDSRCRCGRVAPFTLVTPMNQQYSVALWIMTADPQHSDKPFFFDVHQHDRLESPRKKRIVESMDVLLSPAMSATNTPRASRSRATSPLPPTALQPSPGSAFSVTPNRPTMRAPWNSKRGSLQQQNDSDEISTSPDDDLKLAGTVAGTNGLSPEPRGYTPRNRMLQN